MSLSDKIVKRIETGYVNEEEVSFTNYTVDLYHVREAVRELRKVADEHNTNIDGALLRIFGKDLI